MQFENAVMTRYLRVTTSVATTTPDVEKEPEIEYEEVEKPANGTLPHTYDPHSANTSVLEIELPTYKDDTYYYIKLVNPTTEETVQAYSYIRDKVQSLCSVW